MTEFREGEDVRTNQRQADCPNSHYFSAGPTLRCDCCF